MSRATITLEGFVSKNPETRNVTGHSITTVTIPVTKQKKNGSGGYEDDGDPVWYTAEFWDAHGDAVAAQVTKGQLVTVAGNLEVQVREKDGKTYVNTVVTFPTIGVIVRKPKRGEEVQRPAAEEPWAASPPTASGDVWNTPGNYTDETPF